MNAGRLDEARTEFEAALAVASTNPALTPYAVTLRSELGTLELFAGRPEEAEAILLRVEAEYDLHGESAFNRAMTALDLAEVALALDQPERCAARVERARELASGIPGESRLDVRCLLVAAELDAAFGRHEAALATAEEAVALAERLVGPDGHAAQAARSALERIARSR